MCRLAVISSHPIQYNAPLFRLLNQSEGITIKVFYTWGQAKDKVYDPGFGKVREWDIPLLEGYEYSFVENTAAKPGSHHFRGIINPSLINEIKTFSPDALLVFGWSFQSHLKVMRYFHKKIPVIFRGDSTLLDENKKWSVKQIARKFFLRWVYSHVDYALYAGTANKKYFQKFGLKEQQLVFAPHAVNNAAFYDEAGVYIREASTWRSELGIKESDIVFLFAGKLEPKKDPGLLIKAFQQLGKNDAWLVIVGNGVLEQALKLLAKDNSRIIFLPFQNQTKMPLVYRLGNVFVLPSQGPGETWGLAINEAMACERAIIASTKCGCATDLVKEGKNGFTFEAGNLQQLQERLYFFGENHNIAHEFGQESRKIVSGWSYQQFEQALQNLLN